MENPFMGTAVVRLRSVRGLYLIANDDDGTVSLDLDGNHANARWTVLRFGQRNLGQSAKVHLRSSSGLYLVPTEAESPLGLTGRKVSLQAQPEFLEFADWIQAIHDAHGVVVLIVFSEMFLRANGCVPPWRNTVTVSDYSLSRFVRRLTQDWFLWKVEYLEWHPHHLIPPAVPAGHASPANTGIGSSPDPNEVLEGHESPGNASSQLPIDPEAASTSSAATGSHYHDEAVVRDILPILPSQQPIDPDPDLDAASNDQNEVSPRRALYTVADDHCGFRLDVGWHRLTISGDDFPASQLQLVDESGQQKLYAFIMNKSAMELTPLPSRIPLTANEKVVVVADFTVPQGTRPN